VPAPGPGAREPEVAPQGGQGGGGGAGGGGAKAGGGDEEGGEGGGWGELLSGAYSKALVVGPCMFIFQQLSGINAVVFFSSAVFRQAGVANDLLASVAVSATNMVGTVVAGGLLDRAGRRPLLTGSFLGMGASMALLALALSQPWLKAYAPALALLGTMSYIFSFGMGVGPVPALLCAEIFPQRVRGSAMSLGMGLHWGFNIAIGQLFLSATEAFGVPAVYAFFAAVCAAGAAFTRRLVVETKGREMDEIAAAYAS